MGTAQAVASSLADQRQTFDNIGGKLMTIGSKFPIVNGLLNAIRRKKNRVRAAIARKFSSKPVRVLHISLSRGT